MDLLYFSIVLFLSYYRHIISSYSDYKFKFRSRYIITIYFYNCRLTFKFLQKHEKFASYFVVIHSYCTLKLNLFIFGKIIIRKINFLYKFSYNIKYPRLTNCFCSESFLVYTGISLNSNLTHLLK